MSTYVYGLCSPKKIVKIVIEVAKTEERMTVNAVPCKFMHGHANSWDVMKSKSIRAKYMVVNRMWDDIPYESRPQWVFCQHDDNGRPVIGDLVFNFPNGAHSTFTDTPYFSGSYPEMTGKIVEIV